MGDAAGSSFNVKLQDATVDVERLGEKFLINREQMVATDKLRNSNREALTALRKCHKQPKAWLQNTSSSFRRCTTADAVATLEKEAVRLETVMTSLRAEQKQLIALLADKGAAPDGLQEGMLRALLQLKG